MQKLFRIESEKRDLVPIPEQDFSASNFLERYDIQEWIASSPEVLGESLLIIAKEDSCFSGTNERPDLIALDKQGNIVVIELKRDDSGADVHWQAIKYAAYWSSFSKEEILNRFRNYLSSIGQFPEGTKDEDLLQDIGKFVEKDEIEFNTDQRIILVSHRFSKEVVTAVNWLVEKGNVNISCITLSPYYDQQTQTHYLHVSRLYPTPEITEFLIKPRTISQEPSENRRTNKNSSDSITDFFRRVDKAVSPNIPKTLDLRSRWAGGYPNWRYYHFYQGDWDNWNLSFKMWFYTQNNEYKGENDIIRVMFYLHKPYLENKGWDQQRIRDLIEEIKTTSQDLTDFENADEFYTEKVVPFNPNKTEQLEKVLTEVINVIYPIVQKHST